MSCHSLGIKKFPKTQITEFNNEITRDENVGRFDIF